jgi:hypothetical protein
LKLVVLPLALYGYRKFPLVTIWWHEGVENRALRGEDVNLNWRERQEAGEKFMMVRFSILFLPDIFKMLRLKKISWMWLLGANTCGKDK